MRWWSTPTGWRRARCWPTAGATPSACARRAEGTTGNRVSVALEKLDTRDRTRAVLEAITLRVI